MPSDRQISERELRESEIKMTGQPPAATVAFIGFVPAPPPPTTPVRGTGPASAGDQALPSPSRG